MVRKICLSVLTLLSSAMAMAQLSQDSTVTIIDGMKVPLVERKYVAPTHFQDNWYIGTYGGVTSNFGSDDSHAGFFRIMGPAAAITVGKEITPVSEIRLQVNYNRNTGVTDDTFAALGKGDMNHERFRWNTFGLNFDYMPNFTNLLLGFRENRFFHFKGLLGLGGSVSSGYTTNKFAKALKKDNSHSVQLENNDKYDSRRRSLIQIRAGLAGEFRLSPNWHLNVEAVENFLDNSFDSNPTTKNIWDGHLDIMVGVTYHFKNKGGVNSGFYYPRHDMSVYKKKMELAQNIRQKADKRVKEIKETPAEVIDINAHVMYTLIAFDEGETTVDRLQQTNIYTTANAWAKAPKSIIYITNSTGQDNKLFQKRAEAIKDILLERYEIPAAVIKIVASEKDIRPTGDYIEFIVND